MIFQVTKTKCGGGGLYTVRLSDALVKSGLISSVFCLDDATLREKSNLSDRCDTFYDRLLTALCNRGSSAPFHSFYRRRRWDTVQEVGREDVVHFHSITGFIGSRGLKRLVRARPRVFWTAHNPWMFTGGCVVYAGCDSFIEGCHCCPILKGPLSNLASHELRVKRRWIEEFQVQPIANSAWMAEMMMRSPVFKGIDAIPIVPPIVDAVFSADRDRDALRKSLGFRDDQFVVGLSASSLTDPCKGIVEFFETLPVTAHRFKNVSFMLIGDGKICIPNGVSAMFVGRVSSPVRLAELYTCCDLFVSPSFMETFGMAIAEAQACGTPVLAFSTGGTPEAVYPGAPCRLIQNRDFESLHGAFEGMAALTSGADSQRAEVAQWARDRLGASAIAAKQIAIYEGTKSPDWIS